MEEAFDNASAPTPRHGPVGEWTSFEDIERALPPDTKVVCMAYGYKQGINAVWVFCADGLHIFQRSPNESSASDSSCFISNDDFSSIFSYPSARGEISLTIEGSQEHEALTNVEVETAANFVILAEAILIAYPGNALTDDGFTSSTAENVEPNFLKPNFCPQCGIALVADVKFCPQCGKAIALLAQSVGTSPIRTTVSQSADISTNVTDKPFFWALAVVVFIVASWVGGYGIISLGTSNCDFAYFNSVAFPSFTGSFICVSNLQVDSVRALGVSVYNHAGFSIVMTAISLGLFRLGWMYVKKARLSV